MYLYLFLVFTKEYVKVVFVLLIDFIINLVSIRFKSGPKQIDLNQLLQVFSIVYFTLAEFQMGSQTFKISPNNQDYSCWGTGISLWVRGLSRIKLLPKYHSLGRSSTSLITPGKWNACWGLMIHKYTTNSPSHTEHVRIVE